jgi:hypothetical protein
MADPVTPPPTSPPASPPVPPPAPQPPPVQKPESKGKPKAPGKAASKPKSKKKAPPRPAVPYTARVVFPAAPYRQALNARSGPSSAHPVLAIIGDGSEVTVVGFQGSWAQLQSGAWVFARYLMQV